MKQFLTVFLFTIPSLFAKFHEVEQASELQKVLLNEKHCIIAIGMWPCIPCEKLKKKLLADQKLLPDIYWIDLKKHPKMRHVFNFKAVPFVTVYQEGEATVQLTGEKSCREYLLSIQR